MASLALGVRFNPASAGTADFVYSSVVTGYRDATVLVNSKTYRYRAESADLSQWEFGTGIWSSATNTLSRNTVSFSSTGAKVSFTTQPQVSIVINPDDVLQFDDAMTLTSVQQAQGRSNLAVPVQGYLFGLSLSPIGTSTFGIAAGIAANSTASDMMALAAAITKTTGAWAVGSGNGGWDGGGSNPASTVAWYSVFLIKRTDTGVVDVIYRQNGTDAVGPALPTNYTEWRRIGSILSNGSGGFVKYFQNGDDFLWDVPVLDGNNQNPTAGASFTLTTPLGVLTTADLAYAFASPTVGAQMILHSLNVAGQTINTPAANFLAYVNVANLYQAGRIRLLTNTSSQIRAVCTVSSNLYFITHGWTDTRGRLS